MSDTHDPRDPRQRDAVHRSDLGGAAADPARGAAGLDRQLRTDGLADAAARSAPPGTIDAAHPDLAHCPARLPHHRRGADALAHSRTRPVGRLRRSARQSLKRRFVLSRDRAMIAQPARPFLRGRRFGTRGRSPALCGSAAIGLLCWPIMCGAQMVGPTPQPQGIPVTPEQAEQVQPETWAVHGQATNVWLLQPAFRPPYQGPHSLSPAANGRETIDATLYAGIRPWPGAEIWINPEIDQGFGLSNTFGVAGYPSGEAFKLGKVDPYFLVQRGFLRQTVNLGGETEKLEPDLNQLGGTQTANRLVFTIGKYSIVDIFDTNSYAHDPRNDFFNWSIIDQGAFDYAANAWGFTYGRMVSGLVDRQGRCFRPVSHT